MKIYNCVKARKYSFILIALTVACLLLLGGCNSILSRDYMVITPHLENRLDDVADDELRAESFQELKDSILRLIEEGYEVGTIRLYNYSGDVDADTEAAITHTMRNEPLGAYAVEYVSYKSVRILSYYELTLTITYRKTPEEIAAIEYVDNLEDYSKLLTDAYTSYEELLTVELPWYYTDQYSVNDILHEYYVKNPLTVAIAPNITTKEYPDVETGGESGWRRILEISFDYMRSPEELMAMSDELLSDLSKMLNSVELPDDNSKFPVLKNLLVNNSEVLPDSEDIQETKKGINTTAYGAVINKSATSEGYAMAFKALCDVADIECLVVQGRLDGLLHSWNLVNTDGEWYHIDASVSNAPESEQYLIYTDAQMSEAGYRWDSGGYPVTGEETINAISPEEIAYSESEE